MDIVDKIYFVMRFEVWAMAILVVALILNRILTPEKSDKWALAKKLIKPLLIFTVSFLASGSIYLAHEMDIIFVGEDMYPAHWTKIITQAFFFYAFYSIVDAFTPVETQKEWKMAVFALIVIGIILGAGLYFV